MSSPKESAPFHGARVRRASIGDRANPIKGVMLDTFPRQETDEPPMRVVVGNGAFSGPKVLGRLMKRFVQEAGDSGRNAEVVLYSDPWFGTGTYGDAHRTERLNRVFGIVSERRGPAHLVGHSWSWRGAVEVAGRSEHDGRVSTLTGYTPAFRGSPDQVKGITQLFRPTLVEGRYLGGFPDVGSVASMGGIVMNAIGRYASDRTTLLEAAQGAFSQDITTDVLELRQDRNMPVGVVWAKHDAFFAPDSTAEQLLKEGGVQVNYIETTHAGAVTDYRHGATLYHFMGRLAEENAV
jgi:hypothetical protein